MEPRRRLSKKELREAMRERLRYLGFKARRDPRSLTLLELDELCHIVVKLGVGKAAIEVHDLSMDKTPR